MVLLEHGGAKALLPQDELTQHRLYRHARDERERDGLVPLDDGSGEHRCSFLSSTSKDAYQYSSGTPPPLNPVHLSGNVQLASRDVEGLCRTEDKGHMILSQLVGKQAHFSFAQMFLQFQQYG